MFMFCNHIQSVAKKKRYITYRCCQSTIAVRQQILLFVWKRESINQLFKCLHKLTSSDNIRKDQKINFPDLSSCYRIMWLAKTFKNVLKLLMPADLFITSDVNLKTSFYVLMVCRIDMPHCGLKYLLNTYSSIYFHVTRKLKTLIEHSHRLKYDFL